MRWPRISKRTKTEKGSSGEGIEFIERLKRRDERAFLDLYDRHQRSVYRFLMHMTGSTAAAEELTQEVFVTILDAICSGAIQQFDPEKGTLEGYLLGVARNLAREERRRTHRLSSLESFFETPVWGRLQVTFCQENQMQDAETRLLAQSELKALYRAILELPDHYRETIVLCSLQGKSYEEVATILQCSEGTVASRMNRAKALLAAKLRGAAASRWNASSV